MGYAMTNTIEEARRLLDAATKGEWIKEEGLYSYVWSKSSEGKPLYEIARCPTPSDADFIVASKDIVRQLIAEVERLKAELSFVENQTKRLADDLKWTGR